MEHCPSDNHCYPEQQRRLVKKLATGFGPGSFCPSIVEMRADYPGDPERCLTTLAFVPFQIGHLIHTQCIAPLQIAEPCHYFYPLESLHITIKNVRAVHHPPRFTPAEVHRVDRLFQALVPSLSPLVFHLEGVVRFPTSVSLIGYSSAYLKQVVQILGRGLAEIGVPDDKRYASGSVFFGNVTLCRLVRQPCAGFLQTAYQMADTFVANFRVEQISLAICNAACHPATRQIINTYRLCGPDLGPS